MTIKKAKCPECGDELDVWPQDSPVGYCYTCHQVRNVERKQEDLAKLHKKQLDEWDKWYTWNPPKAPTKTEV